MQNVMIQYLYILQTNCQTKSLTSITTRSDKFFSLVTRILRPTASATFDYIIVLLTVATMLYITSP